MAERAPGAGGAVVAFEGLSVEAHGRRGRQPILNDVSFDLRPGEAFGLVGESGCGKSTVALAAMRYLQRGLRVSAGRILFEGRDIAAMSDAEIRAMRGRRVAMVYQDPMSSLNPVMPIGRQLMEVPLLHGDGDRAAARAKAVAMLEEVRLPDPEAMLARYPHQLSGGQQQRAVIAMALMARPALLIMDEPTTGLDVTIEAAILELVRDLRAKFGTAILFISHNLGTVARLCDRVGVLYAGRLVELGSARAVLKRPAHPYTRGLLAALPSLDVAHGAVRLSPIEGTLAAADRLRSGCAFLPRCAHADRAACADKALPLAAVDGDAAHRARCARLEHVRAAVFAVAIAPAPARTEAGASVLRVAGLTKTYAVARSWRRRSALAVQALTDASLEARRHQTLAIVGESGSGKSTLARVVAGLAPATGGSAKLGEAELADTDVDRRSRDLRRRVQMVFQNPDATLNPSHTVEFALMRPLRVLRGLSATAARAEAARLMERVRLPPDLLQHKPHQLSGGQRQRVAIARALAGNPDLVIADEPVSALDVSVQAAIANLLDELLVTSDMALVLISHDLALVRHMADWVAVMYFGRVVEYGPADKVFAPPFHPYTEALLAAAPRPDPDAGAPEIVLSGAMPSATQRIPGCPFASRCPKKIGAVCETEPPPLRRFGAHNLACHLDFVLAPLAAPAA
jgi:peptide/nickel transport system ATP-binding protein